jgi:hypothetical protein
MTRTRTPRPGLCPCVRGGDLTWFFETKNIKLNSISEESQAVGFLFGQNKNGPGETRVRVLARAGAFSNQFIDGMKLLYELEPLIKLKPYLTNQWEKSDRLVKSAS